MTIPINDSHAIPTEDGPTPNVALLKRTLAHIEANPERWEQDDWRKETGCGTAHCFAGWAAVLSGAQFGRFDDGEITDDYVVPPGADPAERHLWQDVDRYASELLGIAPWEGVEEPHLFDGENDLDDLRRFVAELCSETPGTSA